MAEKLRIKTEEAEKYGWSHGELLLLKTVIKERAEIKEKEEALEKRKAELDGIALNLLNLHPNQVMEEPGYGTLQLIESEGRSSISKENLTKALMEIGLGHEQMQKVMEIAVKKTEGKVSVRFGKASKE